MRYAIEFTHSLDENSDSGYLVGIKSTGSYFRMSPNMLLIKYEHDSDKERLFTKKMRISDIKSINIPVMW